MKVTLGQPCQQRGHSHHSLIRAPGWIALLRKVHRHAVMLPQVPKSVVVEVANQADQERYNRYALRSYVEDNGKLEWCPAPGCEHAVECSGDVTGEALDIMCKCGCAFCFNCKEEAHRPVSLLLSWLRLLLFTQNPLLPCYNCCA